MNPKDLAVRIIPCLDVDDGRVVKGVNFENLRDAGDPVELAAAYDREGADELTFLDVTASSSRSRHHARRRQADRRPGLHPADGGRRCPIGGGRRRAAAGRRRQGRRQHRGDRAPRATGRIVPPVRVAVHRVVGRRANRSAKARRRHRPDGRSPPTVDAAAPAWTRSSGQPAAPNSGSAKSCSTRWMSTAPKPDSTSRCCARSAARSTSR